MNMKKIKIIKLYNNMNIQKYLNKNKKKKLL